MGPPRSGAGGHMSSGAEGAGDPQMGVPFTIDVNAGWRVPFTGLLCKQPPMAAYAPSICARGEPFGIARSARRVATAHGAFLPCCRSISARRTMATRSSPRADSSSSPRRPTISSVPSMSKPARRCGRISCRPAVKRIRWSMRSAPGQYLVIMAGGHHFMETPPGDYVIAYTLPQR
jgi:quinoprotein glucose dehydrogenase